MPTLSKCIMWEGEGMVVDKGTSHKITGLEGPLGAIEFKFYMCLGW